MPRVVKSREEFEGEVYESLVLVEGSDLPQLDGAEHTQIAHARRRIDGTQRVSGHARYTQDIYLPGMLFVCAARIRARGCVGSTRRRPKRCRACAAS